MDTHDDNLDLDTMHMLYARTLHSLRETRKALLSLNDVMNEEQLLLKIRMREVAVHPGYEQYLGAKIIEQTRMQLREDLIAQGRGIGKPAAGMVSMHLFFQSLLEEKYGRRLAEPLRIAQDALLLSFDTGLMVEARFFSGEEYCLRWSWGEAEFCIDTAPVHPGIESAPAHLYFDDGRIVAWHMISTTPKGCWENFSALLDTLLKDPLLEQAGSVWLHDDELSATGD